jgi:outer membrane protein assembly factor BamD (BamD/ComL family)
MGRRRDRLTNAPPVLGPVAFALLLATVPLAGCGGPLERWRIRHDDTMARPITDAELGDHRPFLSWIKPRTPPANSANVDYSLVNGTVGWRRFAGPAADPDAETEFQAAEGLFTKGQLAEAEGAFARLARRKKGTAWGEKAQFYLAEAQFQQGKLVKAHDSYETLFADYGDHPGARYVDQAVSREFAIAQTWLTAVNAHAEPDQKKSLKGVVEGKFPVIDVGGNALAVLEHVRHHDPLGPLADDAVMKIADYHYERGNYEDAAFHYDQIPTDYEKSELLQQAQLASIDSKMKAYIGPEYDGRGLGEARKTIDATQQMFPERQASHSDEVNKSIALIDDQMAERAYKVGEHYLWTGKVTSAEYSFGEIPARWPKSEWAAKAQEQLAKIATMPRNGPTKASTIMTQPGAPDPTSINGAGGFQSGMQGGGMNSGMGGTGSP